MQIHTVEDAHNFFILTLVSTLFGLIIAGILYYVTRSELSFLAVMVTPLIVFLIYLILPEPKKQYKNIYY